MQSRKVTPECIGHHKLARGILARCFLDIKNGWILPSAYEFLLDDWSEYLWESTELHLDDRERLTREVESRMKAQNEWAWEAFLKVWQRLPEHDQACLEAERIFLEVIPDKIFKELRPDLEPLARTAIFHADRGRVFILINEGLLDMAAWAGDKSDLVIQGVVAHELAHIKLLHHQLKAVCDWHGITPERSRGKIMTTKDFQHFHADYLASEIWGFKEEIAATRTPLEGGN